MNKLKYLLLTVLLITSLFFFAGCSQSITEEEAINFTNPIIKSIAEFKEKNNSYPKSLMEISSFPYEIKPLASTGEYYFLNENDLTLYAGGKEAGLGGESEFIYYVQVSFDESKSPKAITSIFIGFKEDGSYDISYTRMPPLFKQ